MKDINKTFNHKRKKTVLEERNKMIKKEFLTLREKGIKNKDACIILAAKYFISESRINAIVYDKKINQ